MLLNLSNHPSIHWNDLQLSTANQDYGEISDMPFPNIPPEMCYDDLMKLVNEYLHQIVALNPSAVHLMGELTFTYNLVTQLKVLGFPCIASTSSRFVTENGDGNKISYFNFVQFREY
ncbi:MAG: hypothetical protein K9I82_15310 [Chitinophagaceae bacterium]|nr:hypothetical protein [Chitinophagaceae bacterium]